MMVARPTPKPKAGVPFLTAGWSPALARSRRALGSLLSAVVLVPGLAAFAPPAAAISDNVAIHAVAGDMPSADPPFMLSWDTSIGFNVYETLTRWEPEKGLVPVLATSWESNADGTEWTFSLREGVTFHDGSPFTAADVKASLDRNIEIGMVAYDFIGIESIEAVDDHTVRFVASAPRNVPLIVSAQYGMFIYKASAVDEAPEWWAAGNDAGTGPYTLETFEPGNRVVLDRYAYYWGGWEEGQFTKVVYVITEDPTVRDQMIRSGDADMTSTLPFDSLESLQGHSGLQAYPALFLAHLVAGFDLSNPPLDDPKVRQALAHTFPYEDVHQGIYLGHGEIAMGFGPSSLWEAPADFPRYRLDLERAGALLAEAGHADGFELDLALSAGVKETVEAMSLWQAQLAKVNVELNIRQLSTGAFWDYAFNPDNEEYDVFVVTAAGDVPSPYSWLVVYTSSPLGWMPYVGHKNDAFDRLVFDAWALEATDADAANDLWVEAQRILHDDAASIFVMDAPTIIAHGDDIVGFEPNPPYANIVFWYQIRRQ